MSDRLPVAAARFPGLAHAPLARRSTYLDSACLTPAPREVVDAVGEYYRHPPGCPLRNGSEASHRMEERIREARESVARLLGARYSDEIVFTPNATFGINLVAGAFRRVPGKVLITDLEHNSNRLPWLRDERVELAWPPGAPFPMDEYRRALAAGAVKLVSMTALSNVTGAAPPLAEMTREARAHGVPVHFDGAQAFACRLIDVTECRPEFVSFSLHKAYGPSGLGGLYLRRDWQARLAPEFTGAGTVDDHDGESVTWTRGAPRFEYGLGNYAALYAVPPAMEFLGSIPAAALAQHYGRLHTALRESLGGIGGIRFVGPPPEASHHICSFRVEGVDAARLGTLLDSAAGIQVRHGRMCAHHWFHRHGIGDLVRVSFGVHNTVEEAARCGHDVGRIIAHYL